MLEKDISCRVFECAVQFEYKTRRNDVNFRAGKINGTVEFIERYRVLKHKLAAWFICCLTSRFLSLSLLFFFSNWFGVSWLFFMSVILLEDKHERHSDVVKLTHNTSELTTLIHRKTISRYTWFNDAKGKTKSAKYIVPNVFNQVHLSYLSFLIHSVLSPQFSVKLKYSIFYSSKQSKCD